MTTIIVLNVLFAYGFMAGITHKLYNDRRSGGIYDDGVGEMLASFFWPIGLPALFGKMLLEEKDKKKE